jgi:hypothetical protein
LEERIGRSGADHRSSEKLIGDRSQWIGDISLDATETFDFSPDIIYHEHAFVTSMMISHTLDRKYFEFSSSGTKRSGQRHSNADSSHGDQNNS